MTIDLTNILIQAPPPDEITSAEDSNLPEPPADGGDAGGVRPEGADAGQTQTPPEATESDAPVDSATVDESGQEPKEAEFPPIDPSAGIDIDAGDKTAKEAVGFDAMMKYT